MTEITRHTSGPTLVWFRRDLRLGDHPALSAAVELGAPVIPVFILDPVIEEVLGAAAKLRLEAGLRAFARAWRGRSAALVLRRGEALGVLRDLIGETGARRVFWSRLYDGAAIARDRDVKQALRADGIEVESFPGSLLHEPWRIKTGGGTPYKVFTPYCRAAFKRGMDEPIAAPSRIPAHQGEIASDDLADWRLSAGMGPAAEALERRFAAGEEAAHERMAAFIEHGLGDYDQNRNFPAASYGTSGLSPFLAAGEISPATVWAAFAASGAASEPARRQLVWRDFAYHLLFHAPDLETENWRESWNDFPWRGDNDDAETWRRGVTGIEMIDAAMRELYVSGWMHNRMRMLVASFLTKNLMTHWGVGERWFRETLIDWDPANNSMGWQWVAGSGPDAAPYFRIFNPETQAQKFDPDGAYRRRWLIEAAEGEPHGDARAFFDMAPKSWNLEPNAGPRRPMVDVKSSRKQALAAYRELSGAEDA